MIRHSRRKESGQGLIEYALILMLVALVVIIALQLMGTTLVSVYYDVIVAAFD